MGAIGAVFQPELIKLMKAVLDDAAAMLPEAKAHIDDRRSLSRRGVYSLFARYLSGARGSLRQKKAARA